MSLLDQIDGPEDLKRLPAEDLPRLAREIRERIVDTVCNKTGGHFASNLGVVELTIALHRVFDFPHDRLLLDVGHQAYPHKLLTGRRDRFDTIRQRGGLSGFASKFESEYDTYLWGHAGTSISCALGLACGDAFAGRDDRHTVAVIGDSSIGAGMAFEALNHAGEIDRNLLVVLNDNRMSIHHTTGALTKYLQKIRAGHLYQGVDKEVHALLQHLPLIGDRADRAYERLKDIVKAGVFPGQYFENLGFRYFGPVDGHDLDELTEMLSGIKETPGARLLHVLTDKGHGHELAMQDPFAYHAVKPTAKPKDKVSKTGRTAPAPSYTKVFGDAMLELAAEDEKIVAITAAMPDGTGLLAFHDRYPDRYFDVGICEQHAVGLASGLALAGMKPVAAIYSTFLQRGYDQVFHEVCLQNNKVVFCLDRAGVAGADGATHNGCFDLAYLRTLPNIVLMAPKDMAELEEMLRFAVRIPEVAAIRWPRASAEPPMTIGRPPTALATGKAEWLRDGPDGAILAYGSMVAPAFEAAKHLLGGGLDVAVVNARFCKPLDGETVERLARTKPFLVTAEEHMRAGGFGSAVLEHLAGSDVPPMRVRVLALPDRFLEHGGRDELLAEIGLDATGIERAVREMVDAEAPRPRG